jgi:hypothetical protein
MSIWQWLTRPHPRLTDYAQASAARLFQTIMAVHLLVSVIGILLVNHIYVARINDPIWDDTDLWVLLAGMAGILIAYVTCDAAFFYPR